ncbi:MAG: metal-dependent hydrolase [Desulfitobacteriia bacterium]|jgi:L-ascorbate metabolism protein UlaG (beta-lactamase superfamily)
MKVKFYGHACFEIESHQGKIIIDPFLRHNPQANVSPEDLGPLDAILITHGHGDHFGDAIELAEKSGALIIANFEVGTYAENRGAKVHTMHIGGEYQFPFGTVRLTPAFHGSGIPQEDGTFLEGGLPCGFLIKMENKWVYHTGDTGLFGDMGLIGNRFDLELAMIPIGGNYVMGPEDAVLAAQMLKPKRLVPMHFNTFPVIEQDAQAFLDLLKAQVPACQGILLKSGQSLEI